MWPSSMSRSAVKPAAQDPSRRLAPSGATVHGEQMTLKGAFEAASVRSSHARCAAPRSVLLASSGSVGSLLWRRWSSTQNSAAPAVKR